MVLSPPLDTSKGGNVPAPSAYYCAEKIHKLLKAHKNRKRGTMSHDYFREVTERSKISDAFLRDLDQAAIEHFGFHVSRISKAEFVVVRTSSRYFDDDPAGAPDEDEIPTLR